jgi:CRISPR-associated protein Cmr1
MRELKLSCLTPLWTGDIDGKSNTLQVTGLMGSLRWWIEIILRGMNKFVCEPTTDDRCPQRDESSKIEKYCSACLIFGATGLRRLFKINLEGGEKVFTGGALNIKPNRRNRGWYLGSGIVGDIELEIILLDKDFDENLILLPLLIASKWSGIGARLQHGYGVVMIENLPEINFEKFQNALSKIHEMQRLNSLKIELRNDTRNDIMCGYPDIREMFFAKVQFESESDWWRYVDGIRPDNRRNYNGYVNDPRMQAWIRSNSVPISPAIKNCLRYGECKRLWQTGDSNKDKSIENWLFGTILNDKSASKINISCAYHIENTLWEFRIWGWIPGNGVPNGFDRNQFLNDLKGALDGSGSISIPWINLLGNNTQNHRLSVWREFNSPRDTVRQNENDIKNYLQSLKEMKEALYEL